MIAFLFSLLLFAPQAEAQHLLGPLPHGFYPTEFNPSVAALPASGGKFYGQLRCADSDHPLRGASIQWSGRTAQTDSEGNFSLALHSELFACAEDGGAIIQADGYASATLHPTLAYAAPDAPAVIRLQREGRVELQLQIDGQPLPGARVLPVVRGAEWLAVALARKTDQEGRAILTGLPVGLPMHLSYRIADGSALASKVQLVLQPGQTIHHEEEVEKLRPTDYDGTLSGRVLQQGGAPAVGAYVAAEQEGRKVAFDWTAEDGSFELSVPSHAELRVTASVSQTDCFATAEPVAAFASEEPLVLRLPFVAPAHPLSTGEDAVKLRPGTRLRVLDMSSGRIFTQKPAEERAPPLRFGVGSYAVYALRSSPSLEVATARFAVAPSSGAQFTKEAEWSRAVVVDLIAPVAGGTHELLFLRGGEVLTKLHTFAGERVRVTLPVGATEVKILPEVGRQRLRAILLDADSSGATIEL